MASQNLGQVAGLWIGTTAPTNTTLIWYDSTPAIRCHKVYDAAAAAWVVLSPTVVTAITYSVLKNLAQGEGLTQGGWFKITDQGNILALAITSTKIQYVDVNNNFTIDDLAANSTYVVSSSNLLIDDVVGVWDTISKKLKFSFEATSQDDNTGEDYLFGKKTRNNVWKLAKYKFSEFISAVTGNSLSWNKGIFFNFNKALSDKIDVKGGIVSKDVYDEDKAIMQQSIDNVSSSNQQILNTAKEYTNSKTTSDEIYGKSLSVAPTPSVAVDIAKGDSLFMIVNKVQRWITQFKVATGIKVSQDFEASPEISNITKNDTVDSALRKVQKRFTQIDGLKVPVLGGRSASVKVEFLEGSVLKVKRIYLEQIFQQIADTGQLVLQPVIFEDGTSILTSQFTCFIETKITTYSEDVLPPRLSLVINASLNDGSKEIIISHPDINGVNLSNCKIGFNETVIIDYVLIKNLNVIDGLFYVPISWQKFQW